MTIAGPPTMKNDAYLHREKRHKTDSVDDGESTMDNAFLDEIDRTIKET